MRTVKLSDNDYDSTFVTPMRDIHGELRVDIWPYVDTIPRAEIGLLGPVGRSVAHVYLSGDARFHHFLLPTYASNVYLVVIARATSSEILGHHVLDLNEKYSLEAPVLAKAWRASSTICAALNLAPDSPTCEDTVGIALDTLDQDPLNGMRVRPVGKTSGWYLWGGETLSKDPNFFQPLHVAHLAERCPKALPYLALPPGWRFLLGDDDYVDTWQDSSLLGDL